MVLSANEIKELKQWNPQTPKDAINHLLQYGWECRMYATHVSKGGGDTTSYLQRGSFCFDVSLYLHQPLLYPLTHDRTRVEQIESFLRAIDFPLNLYLSPSRN